MGRVYDMYEMSNRYVLLKLEFQDKVKIAIIPFCIHQHNEYLRSKLLLLATNTYRLHFPKYNHYTNALCTELRYDIDDKFKSIENIAILSIKSRKMLEKISLLPSLQVCSFSS